ncbi:amidohydrolase family protein [Streptomyces melanosporofaciens]|uniref:amidohydrolase family protein n=1 Tax=Streptomyces melanosporofaciens TaxID=67327 RepID=UPI00313A1A39
MIPPAKTDATTRETARTARTALRVHHDRLIDGTGASPVDDAVITVDAEGTITYAGPAATVPSGPTDASPVRDVGAGGRTVLPGFFDCHVHLAYAHRAHPGRHGALDPVLVTYDTATRLRQTLDAGTTTARDLAGLAAGYRTAVETGRIVGPRLHTAVRVIGRTGGHADFRLLDGTDLTGGEMAQLADTVDEARLAVREGLRAGADVIKICATGGMASPAAQLEAERPWASHRPQVFPAEGM